MALKAVPFNKNEETKAAEEKVTTKEAMNAIVAPKVLIDSDWEARSSATTSATKSKTNSRDMDKAFTNMVETSTRLLTTLVQNSMKKEDDTNATQLRLYADILSNPNIDEANKVRAQSLMESLLQSQMDELQR